MPIFDLPGERLVCKANAREHWAKTDARTKRQRTNARLVAQAKIGKPPPFPVRVVITRVSPGTVPMDKGNLWGAVKAVQDGVADWLGVDDGQAERAGVVAWEAAQRRGPWGCEVRVEALRP